MAFSERQKLAEEIIFLSEKRGMTGNDLHASDGRDTEDSGLKHKLSFENHIPNVK